MISSRSLQILLFVMVFPFKGLAAEVAGSVIYAHGDVRAVDPQGVMRVLAKNSAVYSEDTVETENGRVHLRFTDGGFAALNPRTRYRIDEYHLSGEPDEKERSFLSLLRGSVRLVTGRIGRINREGFRLRTPVATIGIRGTSGLVQHCAGDCPGKEDGTYLAGYGGIWDLESGDFRGAVESGQSFHCTGGGAGCTEEEGSPEQREEVVFSLLEEDDGDARDSPAAAAGAQVGENGKLCDFGGACGTGLEVLEGQSLAFVGVDSNPGETDAGVERTASILTEDGVPFGYIAHSEIVGSVSDFYDVDIVTNDLEKLESGLATLLDPVARARAELALSEARADSPGVLEQLATRPASIAAEDFGQTADGVLTKGRFQDGFLLFVEDFRIRNSDTGQFEPFGLSVDLLEHNGFQSTHFIFGTAADPVEFFGNAIYSFTGGTFSTSQSGATIGMGATGGQLNWVFGLNIGVLDMTVVHGASTYRVGGNLFAPNPEEPLLFENVTGPAGSHVVAADAFGEFFQTDVEGFFAGSSSSGIPAALGLYYRIDVPSDPILGTAGFGISASTATTQGAAPNGTSVAWSHTFVDTFNSFGFGVTPVAFAGIGTVDGAFGRATLGDPLIFAFIDSGFCGFFACTFNSVLGSRVESGNNAGLSADWSRFRGNYFAFNGSNIDAGLNPTNRGDFHVISSTDVTPPTEFPSSGTVVYATIVGGTQPTLNSGADGSVLETGSLSSASVIIDYTAGDITSVTVSGSFPSAGFSLSTLGPTPIGNGTTSFILGGGAIVDAGACNPSCPVSAAFSTSIVGPNAAGVIGSYGAGTNVPAVKTINGTFAVTP